MITHHITDSLLMGFAAGALSEPLDLIVASHVSLCDDARARLSAYESVGGAMLEAETPVDIAHDSFDKTLQLIMGDAPTDTVHEAVKAPMPHAVFPKPLRDYVGGDLDSIRWRPLGFGVKQAVVTPRRETAVARLLSIPAGQAMPDHGHSGLEVTLVLEGAYIDANGRFARGDIEVATEEDEHTPVADIGGECICLVVTDAPLRFNGVIPKVAQKILRI